MKGKYEISEASEDVQQRLLESYFSNIREAYLKLKTRDREYILIGLDTFLTSIQEEDFTKILPPTSKHKRTSKNLSFSRMKAKEVREESGLSQAELARKLGFLKVHEAGYISLYETGRMKPYNPPKGEFSRAYMAWLKEQGYDPYNL